MQTNENTIASNVTEATTTAENPASLEAFIKAAQTQPTPYYGKKKERTNAFDTMQDLVLEALGDYPKDEEYHAVLLAQVGPVRYRKMIANARIVAALFPVFEKPVTGWNQDAEEAPIKPQHLSLMKSGEAGDMVTHLFNTLLRMETDPVLYTWIMAAEYLNNETFHYLRTGKLTSDTDTDNNLDTLHPAILAFAEYYRSEVYRETGNRDALPPEGYCDHPKDSNQ